MAHELGTVTHSVYGKVTDRPTPVVTSNENHMSKIGKRDVQLVAIDDQGGEASRDIGVEAERDDEAEDVVEIELGGDKDARFSQEEIKEFENSSEGKFVIGSFFFVALFYMWPYQTLIQTQNYLKEEFPEQGGTVGNLMMLCTTWPFLITHVLNTVTGASRKMSYTCKMVVPPMLVAVIAIVLMATMSLASSQTVLLNSLYGAALLSSILEGVTEPASYDMAGLFPSALTTMAVQAGNGSSGLIVSCVNILVRLVTSGLDAIDIETLRNMTFVFFAIMGLTSLGMAFIYWFWMRRDAYFVMYVKREHGVADDDASLVDSVDDGDGVREGSICEATREAIRHVWPSLLAIFVTYLTSLTIWPVIPGAACVDASPDAEGRLQSWWFDIILLTFNLTDFLGKCGKRLLSWGSQAFTPLQLLGWSFIRMAFVLPLILTAAAPQVYDPLIARVVLVLAVAFLGFSNGWLSTICFMRAPKALPPDSSNLVAEQASSILVMGLFAGISFGCLLAYTLGLYLPIGQCYVVA